MKKHIVCFSGGHSSALVAEVVVRRFGAENVVLVNHGIQPDKEDADIQRFKEEVAAKLGVAITYSSYQDLPREELPDQFDIAVLSKGFKAPSTGNALCTARLKTEPFEKLLADAYPPGSVVIYYGFDDDEQSRIQRRRFILGEKGYETCFPLAEWPDTLESIEELGITPPRYLLPLQAC